MFFFCGLIFTFTLTLDDFFALRGLKRLTKRLHQNPFDTIFQYVIALKVNRFCVNKL